MRVLQVIDNLRVGGAETLLSDLVSGLVRRGIECDVYLLQSSGSHLEERFRRMAVPMHVPLETSLYSPRHALALKRHLRRSCCDVVHVHLFPAQLWAALAAGSAAGRVPLVTTEHNSYNRRRRRPFRPLDRWMYGRYARIACISAATRDALVAWLPELAGRSVLCPNGINVDAFDQVVAGNREELFAVPAGSPVIISVGRLETQKDHATAIRALAAIPRAHLAIAGSGFMLGELQSAARSAGVTDRVHFLGLRSDIPRLLKSADVYVQSSRWEGFGIAAVEAMAAGLPVIASRVPGLAEVVADAGCLFEPGDARDLAAKLELVLNDAELRARMRQAGRARAGEFSVAATCDAYEALYRDLVERKAGAPLASSLA
jgi:glycosyltransferase involved in cell wall biosynthesis